VTALRLINAMHCRWMVAEVKFDHPTQQLVLQEYIDTVVLLDKRIKAFDEHIQRASCACVFWPAIRLWLVLAKAYKKRALILSMSVPPPKRDETNAN
jgi:hypothetical protein